MTENIMTTVSNQDNQVTLPLENGGMQTQAESEATQTSEAQAPPKRKRKSKAELLAIKLTKRAELDAKIAGLQKELDETTKKTRNHGLVLIGLVVEQCFKKNMFSTKNKDWWHEQAKLLPEKNRKAYTEFLKSLEVSM